MQFLHSFHFYKVLLVGEGRLFYSASRCSFSRHVVHTEGLFLMETPSNSVSLKTLRAALDHPKPMG